MSGIYRDEETGYLMDGRHGRPHRYWTADMLSYLKRYFHNTPDKEIAECLGLNPSQVAYKAHRLGMKKDADYMKRRWADMRIHWKVAWHRFVTTGEGNFKPFPKGYQAKSRWKKGHQLSESDRAKQVIGYRRWYLTNPDAVKARNEKLRQMRLEWWADPINRQKMALSEEEKARRAAYLIEWQRDPVNMKMRTERIRAAKQKKKDDERRRAADEGGSA